MNSVHYVTQGFEEKCVNSIVVRTGGFVQDAYPEEGRDPAQSSDEGVSVVN